MKKLLSVSILIVAAGLFAADNDRPEMVPLRKDAKPFQYVDANVPFYPPKGGGGEPLKKMQLPLDPAESMKHMVHPAGFELKLFVDESKLGGKPICMNWDERGRLWVAVTMDYPNDLQPEGKGRDRILICEDTDGDGLADKITVFADKLSIPTSLTFARGGVIVHQAPHTLFLKDTNGDDVAGERRVLFSGWHTGDTHAGPSNLHYGFDNWTYGIVGYSGFDGTIGGERHSFRTGFYRFRPDGSKLEFLRNTNNNSWGVGFSEEGILFGSTANGNPSVYLPIPNRYYESVRGWSSSVLGGIAADTRFFPITDHVRQVDFHGRFTAAAGHALYTARTYPKEYWNRTAFVTEPTGHLAATLVLDRNGADFRSRYGWNLLASNDEWCAPIMAEIGPDGNVWIIDWYNYIVQHNPTPRGFKTGKGNAYETELRDKKHGRIYRLVYTAAPPQPALSLKDATPEKLVATLKSENLFWRRHAQRLLVERGQKDVVPALAELLKDEKTDAIGLNVGAIHALWTLHGLGAIEQAPVASALKHPSAGVRRNAVLVLLRKPESVQAILDSKLLDDADAQVRLATLLALAEMPASPAAGDAILKLLAKPGIASDRWLRDAATSAAAAHDLHFLKAAAVGKSQTPVLAIVAEHYARGGPTGTVAGLLADLVQADPATAEVIVAGLAKGWPRGKTVQPIGETEKNLTLLAARLPADARGPVIRLATSLGSDQFSKQSTETAKALVATVLDDKAKDEERIAAARQAMDLSASDAKLAEKLLEAITPRTPPQVAVGIIDAVGAAPAVGPALVQRLPGWSPSARAAAIRALLSRAESIRVLLDAVEKGQLPLGELALDQRQALASHTDKLIAQRARKLLEKGGGLPSPDRVKVLEALLPLTKQTGDPAKGKEVFKAQCAKCHQHNGEGNKVGPDLTGMAVHPKEHILTDVIDPSRNVEGNFRVYVLETKDGRVLNGLLASESKTAVELLDAEAKTHRILREDIESLTATPKSLMPDGFEKQVSEADIVNLLEFLTQRGKYLPLPLDKVATVVSTKGMFFSPEATAERLIFPDWAPKTFEGVPFLLVDPRGDRVLNAVLLYGPQGKIPPTMPKSVKLPCNAPAKQIHFLSGVSGWGFPLGEKGSVTLIVRLHYDDGQTEDHPLKNGEHFADYIRRVDVPGSKFAFALRSQQLRYLAVTPKRNAKILDIELIKGPDQTAPVVMAVTIEGPE